MQKSFHVYHRSEMRFVIFHIVQTQGTPKCSMPI